MVQFLSIIFFSWISSIFVGGFPKFTFYCVTLYFWSCKQAWFVISVKYRRLFIKLTQTIRALNWYCCIDWFHSVPAEWHTRIQGLCQLSRRTKGEWRELALSSVMLYEFCGVLFHSVAGMNIPLFNAAWQYNSRKEIQSNNFRLQRSEF